MPTPSQLGGKLGPRIARVVNDAMADHLRNSTSTRARIITHAALGFFKTLEEERDTHTAPLLKLALGAPGTRPEMERVLRFIHHGSGELASLLGMRAIGAGVATGLGSGLANLLAPANQAIMYADPAQVLDPATMAQAAAGGIVSDSYAQHIAKMSGLPPEGTDILIAAARSYPGIAQLLELWRRGLYSEDDVKFALKRAGIAEQYIPGLLDLKHEILSPPDLALMVLRGIVPADEGAQMAAQSGLPKIDFERLTLATGEPPGPESLMEALRRGFIDKERFDHGIRQSRIRDEWIDVMTELRYEPMSTADAVEAVVRNYIPADQGKQIAQENGLKPDQWNILLEAHGRPPGLMQMIGLQRRGLVSQAQVDQSIRESDIKDKYVNMLHGLYVHLPEERAVMLMLQHGGIDNHTALRMLHEDGYTPETAAAIVKTGGNQRTQTVKHIALGTVLALYEEHGIDAARAEQLIVALGYQKTDVPLLLAGADLKREQKWREATASVIRGGYLAHKTTATEAQAQLAAEGFPAEQAAYLIRLWGVEVAAKRKQLTEAQILKGLKVGVIDAANATQRLQQLGYTAEDADYLVKVEG